MALEDLSKLFIGLGTIAVICVVCFLILSSASNQAEIQEGLDFDVGSNCTASVTCNATRSIQNSMTSAISWLPIIILTMIGGLLIGLVMWFKGKRN